MSGERTEKATPKKRGEARAKGQVARSPEVNSTVVLVAAFATLILTAPHMWESLRLTFDQTLMRTSAPDVSADTIQGLIAGWMRTIAALCLPVLLAAAAAGLVANVIQNRPQLSGAGLKPDFHRLNVFTGLKRMLGPSSIVELGKTLVKVGVVGTVAFLTVWPQLPELMHLDRMSPAQIADYSGGLLVRLAFSILAILVPLAIFDVVYQRRRHEKSLRMSKQEVKQEARQQDLAPEVRGAMRRRAAELARKRMLHDVPNADVVVTNPTHYAVALRYGKDVGAPQVVAKGADLLALKIRELAEEHDVAIVENPPLARALYREVEVGQEIPGEFFGAVAEVLAFVYRTSRRALAWAS